MLLMNKIAKIGKFYRHPNNLSVHDPTSLHLPNLCPIPYSLYYSSLTPAARYTTVTAPKPPTMAVEPKPSVVTIGGKGSAITPSTVYSIASAVSEVKIDSSLLEKLSSKHPISSNFPQITNPNAKVLTLIESRAALFVLLNKLLIPTPGIRPLLPTLISETLNRGFEPKSLDFGSTIGFLESFYGLNGNTLEEMGVTDAELVVLENSCCEFNGICAILDYCSTALSTVADAVGALSCEASKADVSGALCFVDSGDGFSAKDAAAVASDLKVLLMGSKFVGKVESSVISEIPNVHGSLREVVRLVHSRIRVELNSSVKGGKLGLNASVGIKKALVTAFLPLGSSLVFLGENSLDRLKLSIDSIDNVDTRSQVLELFESCSKKFEGLRDGLQATQKSYGFEFVHELFNLLVGVREVIALEGALALFLLEINELTEKSKEASVVSSKVEANVSKQNAEKKGVEKKKKKVALGKGTAVIKQLIKDKLRIEIVESVDDMSLLSKWAHDLSLFFDPKDVELDVFLKQIKELVESNETRRIPKVPKGTRDFAKEQMTIRERAFSIIEQVFKRHGATALDTPAFELRETLMGKYGEDSKLIYDLADQGGELCSLRYDLTVPFARYVAMNGITTFKRYQIAKVYRRDNPSKGRYREFYQCDFDIAGQYEVMAPEFEVIRVLTELLDQLNIGDYEVKLNHRKLLDGMLEICGVPPEKFRTICSSIDKLDKQSFEQIKKEMVEEKGLTVETADKIGNLVKKRGNPLEILSELKQDGSQFLTNEGSVDALKDLEILFKALEKSRCINRVVFDLSLARGLDYYTGVIYEAIFKGATQVGSIAAGGRYDNLIGMFGTKQVPAIGVSLGIERVFTIMEQLVKDQNQSVRATETEVLVGILGEDLSQAAELVSELWDAKLKAEFMMHKKDIMKLITRVERSSIPWMVIQGEKELNEGIVKLRNTNTREEISVARSSIVEELKKQLSSTS